MGFTEDFIATYNSRDVDRFVAQFAPNGRYSDMGVKMTFDTRDEIRKMYEYVCTGYGTYEFTHLRGIDDDVCYALEWSFRGIASDGEEHTVRATSFGELDEQGLILAHRDYWNPAHFPEERGQQEKERASYEKYEKV